MNLEIAIVPHGSISQVIHGLLKYLKKSEAWTRGRATIDDIVGFLYSGRMFLWLIYDPENNQGYGFVIAEVKDYPRCKALVLQYTAGQPHHMALIENKMHETMESFARSADCKVIEFFGRPGWEPHAKKYGYEVKTIVCEKYL